MWLTFCKGEDILCKKYPSFFSSFSSLSANVHTAVDNHGRTQEVVSGMRTGSLQKRKKNLY